MVLKWVLIGFSLCTLIFKLLKTYFVWKQRAKPLPEEVRNIYTEERYSQFLAYRKEYRRINVSLSIFSFILNAIFILSNFYRLFDNINPYFCVALTYLVAEVINEIVNLPLDYYATFSIEERYHLNKKTRKEWLKDYLVNFIFELVSATIILAFVVFVCTHLSRWTNGFQISYRQSFFLCLSVFIVFVFIAVIIAILSLVTMHLKYTFTEMEDCALRDQIEEFAKESKKKIRHIKIYDESKKSSSKNAFLLKFLGYREFGIADNFLDENSQEELLAVLLHEIGHLKHKKNILNYVRYFIVFLLFLLLIFLVSNANTIIKFNAYINQSFGLKYTNYLLSFAIFGLAYQPFSFLFKIFKNYVSCKEEKEADYNAVDHGYGQALIDTFTKMSSDELIDVNPHPFIEILEYDHPGMYKRISYIRKRQKEIENA